MEAEVIRMVLNLYHGPEDSCGTLTTGGTESIIMACFAYRNRANQRGIENPVILCSVTAHAAFDKAAHLCGMRVRHVPVDADNRVNLKKMEKYIDRDVCMVSKKTTRVNMRYSPSSGQFPKGHGANSNC